jgi:Spy/CpxP family protein refolding chaperone
MKRLMIWSSVALLLVVTGIAIARADGARWHGRCQHGPFGYIAHQLNLNDMQKSQIKSIWQAERPTFSSLIREFAAEGKEMDTANVQGNLDESKVQEIATRQGVTLAKLLVEKERMKSKIYTTVLTPEQRPKADELQKRWSSRLDRIAAKIERGNNNEPGH